MAEFKAKGMGYCRVCGKQKVLNTTGYCEACYGVRNIDDIVSYIKKYEDVIITGLDYDSIYKYKCLHNAYIRSNDITNDFYFQRDYRSFYIMNRAGLTDEMKNEYFKIMQEKRGQKVIDPSDIVNRLYQFERLKGDKSLQFSFTTKLMHTVNNDYPIYDSKVSKVFHFLRPDEQDIENKLNHYVEQYNEIKKSYETILSDNLLYSTIKSFNEKFKNNNLPNIKIIDFVFWSCGKVLETK
jgi:hypothetical protein